MSEFYRPENHKLLIIS